MKNFINMLRDEAGASAAEYALILAVVGVGIITAGIALQTAISSTMTCTGTSITTGADACP